MPNSARTAYLFQCTGADLYAVSHDKTGANIPRSSCTGSGSIINAPFSDVSVNFMNTLVLPVSERQTAHPTPEYRTSAA